LTVAQCNVLQDRFHIYLVNTGRINISGLNERNLMYFARSLDEVVRVEAFSQQQQQQRPPL
jgi:aspartate aminotransferase